VVTSNQGSVSTTLVVPSTNWRSASAPAAAVARRRQRRREVQQQEQAGAAAACENRQNFVQPGNYVKRVPFYPPVCRRGRWRAFSNPACRSVCCFTCSSARSAFPAPQVGRCVSGGAGLRCLPRVLHERRSATRVLPNARRGGGRYAQFCRL